MFRNFSIVHRQSIFLTVALTIMILTGEPPVFAETAPNPSAEEDFIHGFLRQAFEEFPYHGAYLDEENSYLVISLKINPGKLAKTMGQTAMSIDDVLIQTMVRKLFNERFSLFLMLVPRIQGISVVITWENCQRIQDGEAGEKILLTQGISEFDRFDVNRGRYFEKLSLLELREAPFSPGDLFDRISFFHLDAEAYGESDSPKKAHHP